MFRLILRIPSRRRPSADPVAGEMRILDIAIGKITSLAANQQSSITSLSWRTDESLWFAGWSRLGSTYSVVRLDGTFEHIAREDAVVGPHSLLATLRPRRIYRLCRDPRSGCNAGALSERLFFWVISRICPMVGRVRR